jgi:hypothetical protein
LLNRPLNSFFLVSTLIPGRPRRKNALRWRARSSNCSSRPRDCLPARRLWFTRSEYFRSRNSRLTVGALTPYPPRPNSRATARNDLCVHLSPEMGSPALASRLSSSSALKRPGCFFHPTAPLLPEPGCAHWRPHSSPPALAAPVKWSSASSPSRERGVGSLHLRGERPKGPPNGAAVSHPSSPSRG